MSRRGFNSRRYVNAQVVPILDLQERREERERAALAEAHDAGLDPCEVDVTPTEHEQDIADDLSPLLQASLDVIEKETTGHNAPHLLGGWFDPTCRFAGHPSHRCYRNDGQPLGEHGDCFAEAHIGAIR